ncbi:MAG: hypothetical protein MK073_01255 [Phycisphaerales bacterium]|nr:hypothetical protein [Phycisphaerales bacterium]
MFTAITLTIACVIAWWASYTESRVSNHVRYEVAKLVPRAHANPAIVEEVVVNPILKQPLQLSLEYVYHKSIETDKEFQVIVTSGDDEVYGDGRATHVASIEVNHQPIAKYRIICDSVHAKVLIAGIIQEGSVQ